MMRALPALGPPRGLPPLGTTAHTLGNGLRIVVVPRRELPTVQIELVVLGGAELDEPAQSGRTSMTAEMLDEGTAGRSALAIAEELDYLGAYFSIDAGWDAVTVGLHVLSPRLDEALDVLADVVLNATFPEGEFARKKKERLTALLQQRDEAASVAGKALATAVFGAGHPFGMPIEGTGATIERLACGQTTELYRQQFAPRNAFLIIAGDVDADEIVATVDRRFGSWRTPDSTLSRAALPPVASLPTRILLVDKPDAAQAELRVGHASPARDTEDYFALIVMNTLLGGAFTSRLNMILREEMGVTYGASSRLRFRRHGGLLAAGAAVFTEAAARSAQVIIEQMRQLASARVPGAELQRAQNYIALGLPRSFESVQDIASRLREQLLFGLPDDYWETYVDRVLAVTSDDVMRAAARHLQPESCAIVVVADRKGVQQGLEQAGLGAVLLTSVET